MYISIIRQIRGKMCVLVNMIFIMEEVNMWEISNNGTFEKWTSNICTLKVFYKEDKCWIYVDYKGYNIIIPMGMWGFEEEIQD